MPSPYTNDAVLPDTGSVRPASRGGETDGSHAGWTAVPSYPPDSTCFDVDTPHVPLPVLANVSTCWPDDQVNVAFDAVRSPESVSVPNCPCGQPDWVGGAHAPPFALVPASVFVNSTC